MSLEKIVSTITTNIAAGVEDDNLNSSVNITALALSAESLDDNAKTLARANMDSLDAIVESTLNIIASSEDFSGNDFIQSQFDAARKVAALAIDPKATLANMSTLKQVGDVEGATILSSEDMGYDDTVLGADMKSVLSAEAFDGQAVSNALYSSIAYNFGAAKQDEFSEAFFGTIVIDPTVSGLQITTEVTNIIQGYERGISGESSRSKAKKVPLIKALYDNELLENNRNKIVPVLRAENEHKLLKDYSFIAESNGDKVTTAPMLMGTDMDILNLSQTDATLAKGEMNDEDAIDRTVVLERVYFELTGANADGDKVTEVFYTDVSILPHAGFTYSTTDHHKDLQLSFSTTDVLLNLGTVKTAKGGKSVIFTTLDMGTHAAKLAMRIHGDGNTEFADISVDGSRAGLDMVIDGNGNEVVKTSAEYVAVKAIVDTIKLVAFTVEAYRTNSNLRTRGMRFGYESYTDIINVPLRGSVTLVASTNNTTGNDNDAGKLAAQIQSIGLQTSVAAIGTLVRHAERLKGIVGNGKLADVKLAGIGRYQVNTYYDERTIHIPDILDSRTSTERAGDIRSALINMLKETVIDMWIDSNYGVSYENVTKGFGKKPTVIIGTDPKIKQYLLSGGKQIDLGDDYDVKVVSTPNSRATGKMFITFGIFDEGRNTKPNPFNFGNMLWAPTIATDILRNGTSVVRELHNVPRYAHYVSLPILTELNITGIRSSLGKVAALRKTV